MTLREKIFAGTASTAVLVGVMAIAAPRFFSGQPSLDELERTAINSSAPAQRHAAAAKLSFQGRKAIPHLQRVLAQSNDPEMNAVCIDSLGELYDYTSMEKFLDFLEDPNPSVRNRAAAAVARMTGLYTDFESAEPEKRAKIIAIYRAQWNSLKDTKKLEEFKQHINANLNSIGAKP